MRPVVALPIDAITAPDWNPTEMGEYMRQRLRQSIRRFGMVVPLVVRAVGGGLYETVGGAQRLSVLREDKAVTATCIVVEADDVDARLLSQALNHVAGEENLGLRAEVVRYLLDNLPEEQLLAVLPDSAEDLRALASLGKQDIAQHLEAWQRAQGARLRNLQFRLTEAQLDVVDAALERAQARCTTNETNRRGAALAEICRKYLGRTEGAT